MYSIKMHGINYCINSMRLDQGNRTYRYGVGMCRVYLVDTLLP